MTLILLNNGESITVQMNHQKIAPHRRHSFTIMMRDNTLMFREFNGSEKVQNKSEEVQ